MSTIAISNDHAMIFASSVVIDTTDMQLVAAIAVSNSQDLLKAVKASLMTNSKHYLTIRPPVGPNIFVQGARRGYITASGNLQAAHAEGHLVAWLHPLCGSPQENAANHFYLVQPSYVSLHAIFAERLNLAIPWPVSRHWAEYLLEEGETTGLIDPMRTIGDDFPTAYRIQKSPEKWAGLISRGLQEGRIELNTQTGPIIFPH